jgi:hypothetical protein
LAVSDVTVHECDVLLGITVIAEHVDAKGTKFRRQRGARRDSRSSWHARVARNQAQ